ncbi:unnamed protein product [Penicillium nalgiovense]|nr:unnamed protein product [Penicillium nalgiovense]
MRPEAEGEKEPIISTGMLLVPGVTVSHPNGANNDVVLVVGWRDKDPSNPLNWSLLKKWMAMFMCALIAIAMTVPSSIECATQDAFDARFGVNSMAGSMTAGIFPIGIGVGSLFSAPFSETFGRNAVYFLANYVNCTDIGLVLSSGGVPFTNKVYILSMVKICHDNLVYIQHIN